MKSIPGFAHSVVVLLLAGSATAAITVVAAVVLNSRESIIAHLAREQATIDAYACVTYAVRAFVSDENLLPALPLPLTLYQPTRTLCTLSAVNKNSDEFFLDVVVGQSSHPRTIRFVNSLVEGVPVAAPHMHFVDE